MTLRARLLPLLMLLVLACSIAQAAPFTFAFITDSHVGHGAATAALPKVVDDLNTQNLAFVVHGGDITNTSSPSEWTKARDILGRLQAPLYLVSGNHDAKWGYGGGRTEMRQYFAKPSYSAYSYGGCRFFFLDPTVPLTGAGHFDRKQLDWLRTELEKDLKAPVFIFFHYPLEAKDIDNIAELRQVIAPYRVAAFIVGHGHTDRKMDRDGIIEVMGRDTYSGNGGCNLITVDGDTFRVAAKPLGQPAKAPWVIGNIPAVGEPVVELLRPTHGESVSGSLQISAKLPDGIAPASATYRIDGAVEAPLTIRENSVSGSQAVSGLPGGAHKLNITLKLADGRVLQRQTIFYTDSGSTKALWRFDTGSDLIASPASDGERVYAAAMDGSLYALGATDGKLRWSFAAGEFLYATPCVDGKIVYVASADKTLYALNAEDGKKLWSYETESPILASPITAGKLVLVGSGKEMIALDKETGKLQWKGATDGLIDTRPIATEKLVIFGSWDQYVHAFSLSSGKRVWRTKLGSILNFSPANCWPAFAYNKVFVTTPNKEVFGLDASTGMVSWSLANQSYDSVGAGGESVFTRGLDGKLNAYVPTGQLKWSVDGGWGWDNAPSMPQLAGDQVYTGCKRGYVSCYSAADGARKWKYQAGAGWMLSTVLPTGKGVTYATTLDGVVTAIRE